MGRGNNWMSMVRGYKWTGPVAAQRASPVSASVCRSEIMVCHHLCRARFSSAD